MKNGHHKNESSADYFIPVHTSDGMFSSEYAIELQLANGKVVTFFADRSLISESNGKQCIKAILINSDKEKNIDLALLPIETFETASRWVEVASSK